MQRAVHTYTPVSLFLSGPGYKHTLCLCHLYLTHRHIVHVILRDLMLAECVQSHVLAWRDFVLNVFSGKSALLMHFIGSVWFPMALFSRDSAGTIANVAVLMAVYRLYGKLKALNVQHDPRLLPKQTSALTRRAVKRRNLSCEVMSVLKELSS